MSIETLLPRAKREFHEYVLVGNNMTAQGSTIHESVFVSFPVNITIAKHPFRHHDLALVFAERMEGVLIPALDLIPNELVEVNNCLKMRFNRHGIDQLQADSTLNVFANTVYAFTFEKPKDWDEAVRAYAARGWQLILRDDEFHQTFISDAQHDVFVCHCSEDKESVARPLVKALFEKGFLVWFDEISLSPGDSLIDKIDEGLRKATMGIVVISPTFLAKKGWTNREFRSLATRELLNGKKAIIPIWHEVSHQQVAEYSLELADRVALKTSDGIPTIAEGIARVVGRKKTGPES